MSAGRVGGQRVWQTVKLAIYLPGLKVKPSSDHGHALSLSNLKLLEETALCRISFPVFSQGLCSLCSTIFDTVNVSPFRVTLVITLLRWIRSQHHHHADSD